MRILVHDFGGYAFPVQLSEALHTRGYEVVHMYCDSHQTTPPGVTEAANSNAGFRIEAISLPTPLNKYNLVKRWQQERLYGRLAAAAIASLQPDVVLSANTPLDAQIKIQRTCAAHSIPFVFWLQDLISIATNQILSQKIPVAGHMVGALYTALEKKLLQRSDAIVAITDGFSNQLRRWSVDMQRVVTIPNWAPINRIPVTDKRNAWAQAQRLDNAFCFMYTGTLGMKHNPAFLLELAKAFRNQNDVRVVVVSQGKGASWLATEKEKLHLDNLLLYPYQPADQLPQVLGTADVLVALLDAKAGAFSVPSKVLTYLCAQRPLLLALPKDNQAATLVKTINAGLITGSEDKQAFIAGAQQLYADQAQRNTLGQHARAHAKEAFSIEKICTAFEEALNHAINKPTS
ncbi:MAG: glycosyltransferase family 4 protein [Bacteroidota bacterium]